MKGIYLSIFLGFVAISANADLNGAWYYDRIAPYDSPYTAYSTTSAEVEAVLENGEIYTGAVIIYEQGIYVVYNENRRGFVSLEPGLTIEKKGRTKIRFELPGGEVIVGIAASRINGQRLYLREDAPLPCRNFVLIFSDKYNYEPNITRIKSLKIKTVSESDDLPSESEELFQ